MKFLTKNLLRFMAVIILLTILFRFALSHSLSIKSIPLLIISAVLYGMSMFMSGWIFGKKDYLQLPIFDIGFRFHLVTYLVCNIIGELWFVFNLHSEYEKVNYVHSTFIIWSVFIILHLFFFLYLRKKAIMGMDKSEIFD